MQRDGIDVIGFTAGEPDFDTPQHIKDAAIAAIQAGFTKYTPTTGIEELKAAVCAKFRDENGLEYAPNQIVASTGAKQSLYNAMQALLDPGDECILPAPYWATYEEQVRLAGGVPVIVQTREEDAFRLNADAVREAITPRTRMLLLNSPSNPTGAMIARAEMERLAELAVKHQIRVLSDEIYERLIYVDQKPLSIASLGPEIKKLTVTINGVSKSYAMTGWRLGYCASEPDVAGAMGRLQDQSTSNPTSITQKAAVAALTGPQEMVETMRQEYARRRRVMVDGLNAIPGVRCTEPDGAFYVLPNVSALYREGMQGSDAFSAHLLNTARVAVVPGSGFGADQTVRLSYATSMETIRGGLERIAEAVDKLGKS